MCLSVWLSPAASWGGTTTIGFRAYCSRLSHYSKPDCATWCSQQTFSRSVFVLMFFKSCRAANTSVLKWDRPLGSWVPRGPADTGRGSQSFLHLQARKSSRIFFNSECLRLRPSWYNLLLCKPVIGFSGLQWHNLSDQMALWGYRDRRAFKIDIKGL